MSAIFDSEPLQALRAKVTHDAFTLYEGVALLAEANDEMVPQAIQLITLYVQDVKKYAATANLAGLQEICSITEQHLQELETHHQTRCETIYLEVERLPYLIANYLQLPDHENYTQKLIDHLQSEHWQTPLEPDKAQTLSELLHQDFWQTSGTNTATEINESVRNSLAEATIDLDSEDEVALLLDEADIISQNAATTSHPEELLLDEEIISTPEVSEVATDEEILLEEFTITNTDTELSTEEPSLTSNNEIDSVTIETENLEKESFSEEEILAALEIEEVHSSTAGDSLIAEEPAMDTKTSKLTIVDATTSKVESSLDELTDLDLEKELTSEVTLPSSDELDRMLDEVALDILSEKEVALKELKELEEASLPVTNEGLLFEDDLDISEDAEEVTLDEPFKSGEKAPSPTHLAGRAVQATAIPPNQQIDNLSNKIKEAEQSLSVVLNKFVLTDSDTEEFLQAVEQYTNIVQSLWEMAEALKLTGVQEVCTFVSDNIFELSTHPQSERFKLRGHLSRWLALLLNYLEDPTKKTNALVAYLQSTAWPIPLRDSQKSSLLNKLMRGAVTPQVELIHDKPKVESKSIKAKKLPSISKVKKEKPAATKSTSTLNQSQQPIEVESESSPEETKSSDVQLTRTDWEEAFIEEGVLLAHDEVDDFLFFPEQPTSKKAKSEVDLEKSEIVQAIEEKDETSVTTSQKFEDLSEITEDEFEPTASSATELTDVEIAEIEELTEITEDDVVQLSQEVLDAESEQSLSEEELSLELEMQEVSLQEDELPSELEIQEVSLQEDELSLESEMQEVSFQEDELSLELEMQEVSLQEDELSLESEMQEVSLQELEIVEEPLADQALTSSTEAEFFLADVETLDLLNVEIAETKSDLSRSLVQFLAAKDDSEELLEAAEQYRDHVQSVCETASVVGLSGLQEICTFVNENVLEFSLQPQPTRQAAQPYLEGWMPLIQLYLQRPLQGARNLVAHLSNPIWPLPLEEKRAQSLLSHLTNGVLGVEEIEPVEDLDLQAFSIETEMTEEVTDSELETAISSDLQEIEDLSADELESAVSSDLQEIEDLSADELEGAVSSDLQEIEDLSVDELESIVSSDLQEEIAEEVVDSHEPPLTPLLNEEGIGEMNLAAPEVLELLSGQFNDTAGELATLLETLVTAEDGSEELLIAASSYTEQVQALWETAEMAELEGVQEVCTFINDNVMALGAQDQLSRQASHDLLAHWIEWVLVYLQTPLEGATQLVAHLQDVRWAAPLDGPSVQALQARLLQPIKDNANVPSEIDPERSQSIGEADDLELESSNELALLDDSLTQLIKQITSSQAELSATIERCVYMEQESPVLLKAIENYTSQVQAIWEATETAGLIGLQEVCAFVNDNLMEFVIQDSHTKSNSQWCFKQWPNAVLEYLNTPQTGATKLVELLQNAAWPSPMATERANAVLTTLQQGSTSPEQIADAEAEMRADSIEEDITDLDGEEISDLDLEGEISEDTVVDLDLEAEMGEAASAGEETADLDMAVGENQEISLGSAEVLNILSQEVNGAKEDLTGLLKKITSLELGAAGLAEAVENYADQVQRLHAAAGMLGLDGLQSVCTFVIENTNLLGGKTLAARTQAQPLLEKWPDLVLAYLAAPTTSVISLINHLREPQWAQPLPDEQARALLTLLTQGSSATEEEGEPEPGRETQARPEDVSLAIPEDINRELLEAYLQEAPQHASEFSACIQSIIRNYELPEIQQAKRIAHTLKGSSKIIGIEGIANIGHHLEDILEYFTDHQEVAPPKELTDVMVEAADCLEMMVESLLGREEAPPQSQQVLQSILDWANRIDKGNLDAPFAPTPVVATRPESSPQAKPTVSEPVAEKQIAKPTATKSKPTEETTPEQVLRVPTRTVDNLMRLVGELSISIGQIQERLKHVLTSIRSLNQQDLVLQRKVFELENIVDVRGITGIETFKDKMLLDENENFDPLEFEEYNELHSITHSFIESIADNRELALSIRDDLTELEGMFIHQERLNKEFESAIMSTRMIPVNTIISKLERNVRQTCRMTGKKAELKISGADIMMDSDVLNNLADPLMHVLRNSIDHGLETPEDRILIGKPEEGTIRLDFYRQGNSIVVSCRDDGQGLNYSNIRYTAIQRGLLKQEQQTTDAELARFILMSGFSTKSGVTQVSGRGVGMDVVHTNIRQMKGTLDLHSETGKGLALVIKLPMTLVTVHVLLVRAGQRRFGIPTNQLEQALASGLGEFQKIGAEITFKWGKNMYAAKSLGDLLNVAGAQVGIEEHETRPVILAHEETGVVAVVVDELLDGRNLVMKTMGRYVKSVRGIAGASILGDGTLVPLLDLPELLRLPSQLASSYAASYEEAAAGPLANPKVMIVDDSLSVRKSLSILMEDSGFETLLAKDGLEAIEMMNQSRPNIMLVDMEMPRMNGLELTAHVRASQSTQKIPVFMITSRTTEKHREQAKLAGVSAYLTKPYQDTELLGLIDKALSGQEITMS